MKKLVIAACLIMIVCVHCSHFEPAPRFRTSAMPERGGDNDQGSEENFEEVDSYLGFDDGNNTEEAKETADSVSVNVPVTPKDNEVWNEVDSSTNYTTPATLYSYTMYEITHEDMINMTLEIREFIGTPYRAGGTSISGTDCSGFVYAIFQKSLGITLPRSSSEMFTIGEPVESGPLLFGDLVFFRQSVNTGISHVGIYIAQGNFVHTSSSKGVTVSKLTEKYYRTRFAGARRVLKRVDL